MYMYKPTHTHTHTHTHTKCKPGALSPWRRGDGGVAPERSGRWRIVAHPREVSVNVIGVDFQ